jgi:hypothetical protein
LALACRVADVCNVLSIIWFVCLLHLFSAIGRRSKQTSCKPLVACILLLPFSFPHANRHLPLVQATGQHFILEQATGELGRVPAPPHGRWQLELDEGSVVFLASGEDGEHSAWCSDFLRFAIYTGRTSGQLWVYDKEVKDATELALWQTNCREASWHLYTPPCDSEVQLRCALFENSPGGAKVWLSVGDSYTGCNLKLYQGIPGRWIQKRAGAWANHLQRMGLPALHLRMAAPIGDKEQHAGERCLTFTSLTCHGLVSICANMLAHESRKKGGLAPGEDREKINSFLLGFLKAACAGTWALDLRRDRHARCVHGFGPVGRAAFSLPVKDGLVNLEPWHTLCRTHRKYFNKAEYEALQGISGSSTMPLCEFLVSMMSQRLGAPWLARQVAFQIGSRLDSLSGLLGGLPGGSGEPEPDLDTCAAGLLEKDWRRRNGGLARHQLATLSLRHFTGVNRLCFAGDASRVGGSPHMLYATMEPEGDVAARAPPQAVRQPNGWNKRCRGKQFLTTKLTIQVNQPGQIPWETPP